MSPELLRVYGAALFKARRCLSIYLQGLRKATNIRSSGYITAAEIVTVTYGTQLNEYVHGDMNAQMDTGNDNTRSTTPLPLHTFRNRECFAERTRGTR
jgi:hypothetical protein